MRVNIYLSAVCDVCDISCDVPDEVYAMTGVTPDMCSVTEEQFVESEATCQKNERQNDNNLARVQICQTQSQIKTNCLSACPMLKSKPLFIQKQEIITCHSHSQLMVMIIALLIKLLYITTQMMHQ